MPNPLEFIKKKLKIGEWKFRGFKPGYIYSYKYDPKYRDTLAYYDGFPLIIFLKFVKGGFYGLNIHFTPMKIREKMFKQFKYKQGKKEEIRSESVWTSLNTVRRYFPVIIRRYLTGHIRGRIIAIPPTKYTVEELKNFPTEKFFKLSSNEIFKIAMLQRKSKK